MRIAQWLPFLSMVLVGTAPACTANIGGGGSSPSSAGVGASPTSGLTGGAGGSAAGGSGSSAGNGAGAGSGGVASDCLASAKAPLPATDLSRLTTEQYARTFKSLFPALDTSALTLPADTEVNGYFNRAQGQAPSASLIQDLERNARTAAGIIAQNPQQLTGCALTDVACGAAFVVQQAQRILRTYQATPETARYGSFFKDSAATYGFADALKLSLSALLQAPELVYRVEAGRDAASGQDRALTDAELANRLAYFLTNAPPDAELVAAVKSGKLAGADGLTEQAQRLLQSTAAHDAVQSFHHQWLKMNKLKSRIELKSAADFPAFTPEVASSVERGLDAFLDDAFFGGGLPDLLKGSFAYVDKQSASIYGISSSSDTLERVKLDPAQRAGLLTQAAFLAGMAHQSLQAPILRGVFVLDHLLCSPAPPPPPGVSTDIPPFDPSVPKTLRQVIEESHAVGNCAGCHKLIDGVGFTLENYNAIGAWQTQEHGLPVNASGALLGTQDIDGPVSSGVELAGRLAQSKQVAACVAKQWVSYAVQRDLTSADTCRAAPLADELTQQGSLTQLLRSITGQDFFKHRAALDAPVP